MNVAFLVKEDPDARDIRVLMAESDGFEVVHISDTSLRSQNIHLHGSIEFVIFDARTLSIQVEQLVDALEATHGPFPFCVVAADVQEVALSIQHRLFNKGCVSFLDESDLKSPAIISALFARVQGILRLTQSTKRFRMMVEHTQELITLTDSLGQVQYENPAIETILGYSQDELIGRLAFDLIHEADRPRVTQQYVEELSNPSNGRSLQYRFQHASGEWRHLDSKAKQIPLDGDKIGFIISSRDITREVNTLHALQEREKQLGDAQRLAHIGSWRWDVAAEKLTWSNEMCRIYGLPETSSVDFDRFIRSVHPEDREHVQSNISDALDNLTTCRFEHRILRPDGEIRVLECQGHTILSEDGTLESMVGTGFDITESWKSRKKLEASESHFKALFHMSPEAILVCDSKWNMTDVNKAALSLFDCDREWLLTKNVRELYAFDDRSQTENDQQILAETGELRKNRTLYKSSGKTFEAGLHLNVISRSEEDTTFLYIRDHTDRLENEARLRRLGRHQESLLEQERERISREVHDVLGQMMTAIRMDVSWISNHLEDDRTPEKLEEVSRRILETIGSVRRIAHDLRPGILDDFGLAAAIDWNAKEICKRSGIALKIGSLETVELDPDLAITAFRVAQELITNVVRHANAKELYISVTAPAKNLIISIQDDGQGMNVDSAEVKGSLGLLGIRERLFAWNGRLELMSSPGKGTRAEVIIPVKNGGGDTR